MVISKLQEHKMYYSQTARLAIYADHEFGKGRSKTAEGVLRYGLNPVVAVIDSSKAGRTVAQVLGISSDVPIVGSVAEALKLKPDALLLGIAPTGGQLPRQWRQDICHALESGLDVINGLHDFLSEDEEISGIAFRNGRKLIDVRKPPGDLPVASGQALKVDCTTVLTVGSDVSIGKMTTSLELAAAARKRGFSAAFVATGQTGIMIDGSGIAIDRVIGDFMAGATEKLVLEAAPGNDFVFVEGQGSLVHPGFSGVTLALLHGAAPHALVLCHKPSRKHVKEMPDFPLPPLGKLIALYEGMASCIRPAKVVAIALNTSDLEPAAALEEIARAEKETQLPATDVVRFGCERIVDAIINLRKARD